MPTAHARAPAGGLRLAARPRPEAAPSRHDDGTAAFRFAPPGHDGAFRGEYGDVGEVSEVSDVSMLFAPAHSGEMATPPGFAGKSPSTTLAGGSFSMGPDSSALAAASNPLSLPHQHLGLDSNQWLPELDLVDSDGLFANSPYNYAFPASASADASVPAQSRLPSLSTSVVSTSPDSFTLNEFDVSGLNLHQPPPTSYETAVQASRRPPKQPARDSEQRSSHPDKRGKQMNDQLSACWLSPLCPHGVVDGQIPNPSTCDGACAPHLFSGLDDFRKTLAIEQPEPTPTNVKIEKPLLERRDTTFSMGTMYSTPESKRSYPMPSDEEAAEDEDEDNDDDGAQAKGPAGKKGQRKTKVPHKKVEQKYRDSLNNQMEALRRVVPFLQQPSDGPANKKSPGKKGGRSKELCIINYGDDIEDLPTIPEKKPGKSAILSGATKYIKQLERERNGVQEENKKLREQLKLLQRLYPAQCDDCELRNWVKGLNISNPPPILNNNNNPNNP